MPHHKSAAKRLKTNERDRQRNIAVKSLLRKRIKEYRSSESPDASQVSHIYSILDRACQKGVIPKSRANRLKSRLSRHAS
ncbi:MAG: 30S ribosomal protein S20 [Candidatus Eisenbacteria bacterium]|uniref:Small ribosomal subunit protein bS20 n=1 Tax=Eiseniibacteriota bacterium TaxID=2212470 RepID=A0A7Y2E6R7_UNCEI|nr:30S ribosomal protein S20 [Candidatus Eisenbacteria bacterium]